MAVFDKELDHIDPGNVAGSLRILESYIAYMRERLEFNNTNLTKTLSASGTSTAEIVLAVAALENSVQALQSSVSSINGQISSLQTSVSTANGNITALQSALAALTDRVTALENNTTSGGTT